MDMPQALRIYSIDTVSCLQWRRHSQVFASLGAREQLYADNVRSWAEMPFPYQPLPSDAHIRLITIVKGGNSADIRLTLTVEDSSSCLRYKCLSYTWDGPRVSDTGQEWCDPVFQISINDSSVFVRRNLHDVLHHFRDLGYLGPLWIDALCINQQDGSEKDAQVARMSHIYGGAVEVLAWLGTANNSTVPAMQSMEKLLVNQDEIMTAEAGEKILNLLSKEEFNDDQMIQLFEFSIEFNWFSRIWIVQELLLAKKLIFICGTFTMGLGTVWAAEMLLVTAHAHLAGFKRAYLGGYLLGLEEVRSRAGAVTNTYRRRPFSRGCCGIFRSLFKFSSRRTTPNIIHLLNQRHGMRFLEFTSLQMDCIDFHYDLAGTRSFSPFGGLSTILEAGFRDTFNVDGENKHPLSLLANELRVKKAKNPHDKLYGILGFSTTSPRLFSVRSADSVEETFIKAAVLGLSEFPFLSSLSFIGPRDSSGVALPSWVPDYTTPLRVKPLACMDSRFRTALDWKSNARQSSHSAERMILDGAILYTVAAGYPAHWQNSETSALSNVLNLILSPTSACCPDDDLGLMDLFCRTLHAEFLQEEEISHDEVDNPKVAFQQWLLHQTQLALTTQSKEKADSFLRSPGSEFEHAMHNLLVAGQTALLRDFFVEFQEPVWQNLATILKKDLLGEEFQLYWSVYERNIFQQSWTDVCTNRALLRTESGFLGLGPLQARPGDLICIVKGAAVPYLFRKYQTGSDSVYELLGDVYLHGIMYGERSSELTWGEMVVR